MRRIPDLADRYGLAVLAELLRGTESAAAVPETLPSRLNSAQSQALRQIIEKHMRVASERCPLTLFTKWMGSNTQLPAEVAFARAVRDASHLADTIGSVFSDVGLHPDISLALTAVLAWLLADRGIEHTEAVTQRAKLLAAHQLRNLLTEDEPAGDRR